jgi:glutaconyl-CoA/methylmalonyl-CoA decarboxylase subunit gamma
MKFYIKKSQVEDEYIAVTPGEEKYVFKNTFSENLTINGSHKDIKIFESEEGFTYLEYKAKRYLVEIADKNQNKYTVLVNGVSYSFTIESPTSYKRRKYLEKHKPVSKVEHVTSPMPGKIIEVLIEENNKIKEGDSILILEAMKMQNEIIAQVGGKVKKVLVKAGDNVGKDEPLVEIEKQ